MHGSTAATNAILGLRRGADLLIPRVTFTSPEIAALGAPADTPGHTVRTCRHDEVDRAITEDQTAGFTRLVLDRRGRIAGATIVSPRAGDTLPELTLAVRLGLRPRDLAATMHPYPTYADGPWTAAIAEVLAGLTTPRARQAIAVLTANRRLWVRSRA